MPYRSRYEWIALKLGGIVFLFYLAVIIISLVVYWVLWGFWGDLMLYQFDDVWVSNTSIWSALGDVWFIFAWAFGVTTLGALLGAESEFDGIPPMEAFGAGLIISACAGYFEEIQYRWLAFFGAMVTLHPLDWITRGFVSWFYETISIPTANWSTFGSLEQQLLDHPSWTFGAAIVSASVSFRDQHKYLGWFGWVNSWFMGMVFFWMMFNHGLWSAIVAHFIYDAIIFTIISINIAARNRARRKLIESSRSRVRGF